jgi:hypothetical protein
LSFNNKIGFKNKAKPPNWGNAFHLVNDREVVEDPDCFALLPCPAKAGLDPIDPIDRNRRGAADFIWHAIVPTVLNPLLLNPKVLLLPYEFIGAPCKQKEEKDLALVFPLVIKELFRIPFLVLSLFFNSFAPSLGTEQPISLAFPLMGPCLWLRSPFSLIGEVRGRPQAGKGIPLFFVNFKDRGRLM